MADTAIEWTRGPDGRKGKAWNITTGCNDDVVSPGCEHCYARRMANRLAGRYGYPRDEPFRVTLHPDRLELPLRWRKPRRVFVDSMGDLFHEDVPDEFIAAVFGVMAACPQHTFLVLTKRIERALEWTLGPGRPEQVDNFRIMAENGRIAECFAPERVEPIGGWPGYYITSKGRVLSARTNGGNVGSSMRELKPQPGKSGHLRIMLQVGGKTERHLVHRLVLSYFDRAAYLGEQARHIDGDATNNALSNLLWGTQSENWEDRIRHGNRRSHHTLTQDDVDEIRHLAACGHPAERIGRQFGVSGTQVRNIVNDHQWKAEYEPEWPLKPVWLGVTAEDQQRADERIPLLLQTPAALRFVSVEPMLDHVDLVGMYGEGALLDLVICGAETGPGARPMDPEWARSLLAQCRAAGVPFFFKKATGPTPPDLAVREWPEVRRG